MASLLEMNRNKRYFLLLRTKELMHVNITLFTSLYFYYIDDPSPLFHKLCLGGTVD